MNYQNKSIQAQMLNFLSHNNQDRRYSNSYANSPRTPLQVQGLNNNQNQSVSKPLQTQLYPNQQSQQKINDLMSYQSSSSCLSERSCYANGINNMQNKINQNSTQHTQRNKSFCNPQYLQATPIRMSELESEKINQRLVQNFKCMNQNINAQRIPLENGNNINILKQQNPSIYQQVQNRQYLSKENENSYQAGQLQMKENIGRIQILKPNQDKAIPKKNQDIKIENMQKQQYNTLQQSNSQERGIMLVKDLLDRQESVQQNELQNKKTIIITQLNPNVKYSQQNTQPADYRQNNHQYAPSLTQSQVFDSQEIRGVSLMKQFNSPQQNLAQKMSIKDQSDEKNNLSNFASLQLNQQKSVRSTSLPLGESQYFQFRQGPQQNNQIQQQKIEGREPQQSQILKQSQKPVQLNNNMSYQTPLQSQNTLSQNNTQYSSSQSIKMLHGLKDRHLHSNSLGNQNDTPKSESIFQSNLISMCQRQAVNQQLSPKQNPFINKQINSNQLHENKITESSQQSMYYRTQQILNQPVQPQQINSNKQNISRSSSMYSQGGVIIKNNDTSANTSLSKYDKKSLYQNLVDKNNEDDRFQLYQLQPSTNIQLAQLIMQPHFQSQPQQQYQYRQNQVAEQNQYNNPHLIYPLNNFNSSGNYMRNNNLIPDQLTQNQFQVVKIENCIPENQCVKKISGDFTTVQTQGNSQFSPSFGANIALPMHNISYSQLQDKKILENQIMRNEVEKPPIQYNFQNELRLNLEKLNQQREYNGQFDTNSFQTLLSPQQHDYLPCQSESIQILNEQETKYISEKKKAEESNNKSSEKNNFDKKEELNSPIQFIALDNNSQSQTAIKSPTNPHISDFNTSVSPTKSAGLSKEEKLWNQMSPEARKALIKLNIDKQCDKMIQEIQKEKELRIEKQCDKMIKEIQKEKEARINNQKSLTSSFDNKIKIENQQDQQNSDEKVKRAANKSQSSIDRTQLNYSNEKPQSPPQNQQNILFNENTQACFQAINNYEFQGQVLKVEDLLKSQHMKENLRLLTKSQNEKEIINERKSLKLQELENKDEQNIADPQFTFSNTKQKDWQMEFDFSPERQNQFNINFEFNNNDFEDCSNAQLQAYQSDQKTNNLNSQTNGNTFISKDNQIIEGNNDFDSSQISKSNKLIIIQQVQNENQLENQDEQIVCDQNIKNSSSQKEIKVIQPSRQIENLSNSYDKLNSHNTSIQTIKKQTMSPTSTNESNQKINQNKEGISIDNIPISIQEQNNQTNNIQEQKQKTKEKVTIKQLNIEQLEKEAEIIQKQFNTELFFTPKNNLDGQHFSLFYETRKEKKLRTLQENIHKNVEKILPNAKEFELKKICQSIYESVFSLLREKYNIEVNSSSKSNDNSLSQNFVSNNNIASHRVAANQNNMCTAGVKQSDKSLDKINKINSEQDSKDICVSPIIKISNQVTYSNEKREKYLCYSHKDEDILTKSQKMLDSKQSSYEKKEINNQGFSNLTIPSVFDEQIFCRKNQLEEFKQLLMMQDFEELSGDIFNTQKQSPQADEKQFLENIDGDFIAQNSFNSQRNNTFIQYEEEINNQEESNSQQNELVASPRNNQKIQPCLSPIREIESTYDQIHQSNFGKNTLNDYANTSGDEKCVNNQNNGDTQKSRTIFQTQKGIEEKIEEDDEILQQKGKNDEQNQLNIQVNNYKNKNYESLQSEAISDSNAAFQKLCEEDQNVEQLIKKEDQEKNRQAYYENHKQRNYIFVPLCQQQDSQILSSISPTHQQSSQQNSFSNSRKVSTHQFAKILNTNEDWEQILNISKALNKTSFSNYIHARKSSLQNITAYTPLASAQNTHRVVGSSQQKPTQKKPESSLKRLEKPQQQNKSQNFAQEYLKKCQSTKRQQEEQQLKRIKKTLIANFKYGNTLNLNNQDQKENRLLKKNMSQNQFAN